VEPARIEHHRIPAGGITLHVARAGEGPPVLLLHGFPENWTSWEHQIPVLAAAGYSVLAPDLRGYGDSDRPPERNAYRLPHLVEDAADLIRSTGGSAAVVGHDWGGVIAWALAARHPDLVSRLVIVNAPHPRLFARALLRTRQILRSWYVLFFQLPWLPEAAIRFGDFRAFRRMFRRLPARPGTFDDRRIESFLVPMRTPGALTAALNYYRANLSIRPARAPRSSTPRDLQVETLVVWGEEDPALVPELLDGLERYVPRLTVRRLPGVGHWVQNEVPEEFSRLLLEFLARP
jgi:epoxide hydrolase 4